MSPPTASPLDRLLAAKEIVIACGPGGVGKTTTAAALAAAAARAGGKVLVLTVDPARRLADALGVPDLGNDPQRVPAERFLEAGVEAKGELWAAMLDAKQSWDALVHRHAPSAAAEREILANPLYRNITGRFAKSQEYIAMERLFELHAEGEYDLLVVDTPPSRNALEFLDAPENMAEFFSSGLLRWLTAPYRSRFVGLASRPFSVVADRILGSKFLEEIGRFFYLFQSMYDGFVDRARAVSALLHDRATTFMVVTTLEAAPANEARRFIAALDARRLHLGLLVANKVLPESFADATALAVAATMAENAASLAVSLLEGDPGLAAKPTELARVLEEIGRSFSDFRLVASREQELLHELARTHDVCAVVPHHAEDVADLGGLVGIGELLFDGLAGRGPRR